MPRGLQQIRQGMRALFRETGESFLVGGVRVSGIRADKEVADPLQGLVRRTEITVARSEFDTLPRKGVRVQMGGDFGVVAAVRPISTEHVLLVVNATV